MRIISYDFPHPLNYARVVLGVQSSMPSLLSHKVDVITCTSIFSRIGILLCSLLIVASLLQRIKCTAVADLHVSYRDSNDAKNNTACRLASIFLSTATEVPRLQIPRISTLIESLLTDLWRVLCTTE